LQEGFTFPSIGGSTNPRGFDYSAAGLQGYEVGGLNGPQVGELTAAIDSLETLTAKVRVLQRTTKNIQTDVTDSKLVDAALQGDVNALKAVDAALQGDVRALKAVDAAL
jgi:hypothetical protein